MVGSARQLLNPYRYGFKVESPSADYLRWQAAYDEKQRKHKILWDKYVEEFLAHHQDELTCLGILRRMGVYRGYGMRA